MRKTFFAAILVLAAVAAVTAQKNDKSLENTLMTMEKQAWEAFGKGDGKFFETFLTDDFQMISNSGVSNKAQTIQVINTKPCDLKDFSFSSFKVTMLNKDTALVTYQATQDVTCGGQRLPEKAFLSSVFVKRGSKWTAAFHQETTNMPVSP